MLGAAEVEAKQAAWRAALAEASGVGIGGEVSCLVSEGGDLLVSGGGELLVSGGGEAASGEITVVDCESG